MKVKDYVNLFNSYNQEKPEMWRVIDIANRILGEVKQIASFRKAFSNEDLKKIFQEQNEKANEIAIELNKLDFFQKDGLLVKNWLMAYIEQSNKSLFNLLNQ